MSNSTDPDYNIGIQTWPDLVAANGNFTKNYRAMSVSDNPINLSLSLNIDYNSLNAAVENFMTTNHFQPENVGLTFIHRFDNAMGGWFVTIEFCILGPTSLPPDVAGRAIYSTSASINRYDVYNNGTYVLSQPTTMPTGYNDTGYLDNMQYYANNRWSTIRVLDPENLFFVSRITFPWEEILKLYTDNNNSTAFKNTPYLSILSCSSTEPAAYGDAFMLYPHGIWMFMTDGAIIRNGDPDSNPNNAFANMVADVGGMCPPRDDQYVMPKQAPWIPPAMQISMAHTVMLQKLNDSVNSMQTKIDQHTQMLADIQNKVN